MSEDLKPKRRYSKTRSDLVLVFCAGTIIYTLAYRSESSIAENVISYAFLTIAAVLGFYQGVGHFDYRVNRKKDE